MGKIYCVANTKGGVGKSTVAWQVMPVVLLKCAVIEIDDNNHSQSVFNECDNIAFSQSVKLDELDSVIASISFKSATQDMPLVIDCGGGNDTKAILNSLKELDLLSNTTFVIPLKASRAEVKNAIDTQKLIIENGGNDIVFCKNGELKDFIFWDGSSDFGTKAQKPKNIKEFHLPHTPLFDLAAVKNETISALAQLARDVETAELLKMANGDEAEYMRLAALFRNAKRAKNYVDSFIVPLQSIFNNG